MKDNFNESTNNNPRFAFIGGKLLPKVPMGRVDYILILIFIAVFVVVGSFLSGGKYSSGYVKNPITKVVLNYKTQSYIKENYPDFREDAVVDTATGMLKSKAGYSVRCHQKDDTVSKITVYFDRKFNITNIAVNIKSQS